MSNARAAQDALLLSRFRSQLADGTAVEIRERAGLSRPEGAAVAAVDPSTLWRWERGACVARGDGATRYARFLALLEKQQQTSAPVAS